MLHILLYSCSHCRLGGKMLRLTLKNIKSGIMFLKALSEMKWRVARKPRYYTNQLTILSKNQKTKLTNLCSFMNLFFLYLGFPSTFHELICVVSRFPCYISFHFGQCVKENYSILKTCFNVRLRDLSLLCPPL